MRNLKKILALVLALVMSLSLMAVASADDELNLGDVSDVYAESVDVLTGLKVFMGNKGEFLPKDNITRAEVAAIIYRIVTGDVADAQKGIYADYNKFSDVTSDAWYAGYVNYCANAEYVKGVGYDANGKAMFKPQQNVTGYEALAMILRAIGYDRNNEFTGPSWQIQTAATARNRGILKNIAEGTLGTAATREAVAEILCQTILVPVADYSLAFGYRTTDANGKDNETLAYKTFKMEKISGVVTANEYADLESASPVGAGQTTLKLTDGEKRTMNVASDLDDLGESRYVYVVPQSGSTRYNLVCSKVYDTGLNNVYDSGDAVTTISNSTGKDNGVNDISKAIYLRNYGELTSDVSDWRIEYVIRLHSSTYEAMSMYFSNGTNSSLKKWNSDTNAFDIIVEYPTADEYADRKNLTKNSTTLTVANGAVDASGNWSHIDGTAAAANYTYEYRKVIPMGSNISAIDKDNIKAIFTKSAHITNNNVYDLGEVYVGTSTIAGDDDISNKITHAEFVEKYLKGKENTFTSNGLGNRLKIVDNNNDGVAEYILQTIYTVAIVSNVDADGKISLDIMNADFDVLNDGCHKDSLHNVKPYNHSDDNCNQITSTTKTAVYGDGEVSTGTVVLYAYIDGTAQMEPAAGETAKFNKVVRTDRTATTTDDVEYKESAVHEHSSSLTHTVANLVTNTTYTVYFDKYGNLAAFTEGANGQFTLITDGWFNNLKAGAEYAVRAYNDETASLEMIDITSGGPLFIEGLDKVSSQYNSWGNLRYFNNLNDDGKTKNADNIDDIHTTVAVLENGVLTPVDKVYRYNKQNAMIQMENNVIPGRDNQSTSKGWVWNTAYGYNAPAYNSKDNAGTYDVRGLSTTTYYYVYNFKSLNNNQVTQVVRKYTGYAGLPSIPNALIEDVYAVGTRAVNAVGAPYYTADVVVVELNDNYNAVKSAEQVFIPQFSTVADGIGIDYVDMIRGEGEKAGQIDNVRVNMSASDLRWYDAAGNIVNTRTGNGVVPGLYYLEKIQNTEDEYAIRYMTRNDIKNSGKYAVGYVNKSASSDPANWTGVDRYVFTDDNNLNVGGQIKYDSEFARITNGVGHYYTLSYDAGRIAHLDEDRGTVLEQNPSKDARVLDTVNIWSNETEYGVKPHRNEVLMAYSGNNVVYMISFNEYQNSSDLTRDHAQNVWASLMPESYIADSNKNAPTVTFYGQTVNSNTFTVSNQTAKANSNDALVGTIVVTPGVLSNFDDNAINSVYVNGELQTKNSDGTYTINLEPITDAAATWNVEISYNNGANIDRYTLTRSAAGTTATLTGPYVGTGVNDGKLTIPTSVPFADYIKTFDVTGDNVTVEWEVVFGDPSVASSWNTRNFDGKNVPADLVERDTSDIVSITAVVTAENGTTKKSYAGEATAISDKLSDAISAAKTAMENALTAGRTPEEVEAIKASEEYKALMTKIESAKSLAALQSFVTVTVTTNGTTTTVSVTVTDDDLNKTDVKVVVDKVEEIAPAPAPATSIEDALVDGKLTKNVALTSAETIDGITDIDMNGKTITGPANGNVFNVVNGGNLTLKNGTVNVAEGNHAGVKVTGTANVTLEEVTINAADESSTGIVISSNEVVASGSVITLNKCYIEGGYMGLTINGTVPAEPVTLNITDSTITGAGVYLAGPSNTTIKNSVCESKDGDSNYSSAGLEVRDGNVTVIGGEIKTNAVKTGNDSYTFNGRGTCETGAALTVLPHADRAINFSISGTTITKTGTGAAVNAKAIIFDDKIDGVGNGYVNVILAKDLSFNGAPAGANPQEQVRNNTKNDVTVNDVVYAKPAAPNPAPPAGGSEGENGVE